MSQRRAAVPSPSAPARTVSIIQSRSFVPLQYRDSLPCVASLRQPGRPTVRGPDVYVLSRSIPRSEYIQIIRRYQPARAVSWAVGISLQHKITNHDVGLGSGAFTCGWDHPNRLCPTEPNLRRGSGLHSHHSARRQGGMHLCRLLVH